MIVYNGTLTVKDGTRDQYVQEIVNSGMIDIFLQQEGCQYYLIGKSIMNENEIIVCDGWKTKKNFENHDNSEIVENVWRSLYKKYVIHEERNLLDTDR